MSTKDEDRRAAFDLFADGDEGSSILYAFEYNISTTQMQAAVVKPS